MIPPLPGNSPQVKLANEVARGLNASNMDAVGSLLHKDFSIVIYPKSLGVPVRDREECLKHYAEITTGYGVTHHSVIEAPGKIVLHATMELENPHGIDTKCEAIFISHFVTDDDGSLKLKRIDEFTDSQVYAGVHKALAEANARK